MNAHPMRRISCATLNRIEYEDGRFLLALNKNRLRKGVREYAPFGGAIECSVPVTLGDSPQVTLEKPFDLRLFIREADLDHFVTWFKSRQGRETDPFRELQEELVVEEKLLTKLERSDVESRFSHLKTVDKLASRIGAEGELTRYFFEVFQTDLSQNCWGEIVEKLKTPDCRSRLVSKGEIEAGSTSDGAAVAESCRYLFGEP